MVIKGFALLLKGSRKIEVISQCNLHINAKCEGFEYWNLFRPWLTIQEITY